MQEEPTRTESVGPHFVGPKCLFTLRTRRCTSYSAAAQALLQRVPPRKMPLSLLNVDPAREFVFQGTTGQEETQTLTLHNPTNSFVAFKVKTTSPEAYLVRPSSGCLPAGGTAVVKVLLQANTRSPGSDQKDRFLLLCVKTDKEKKLEKEEWEALQKPELEWVRLSVSFRNDVGDVPSKEADLKAKYEELRGCTLQIEKQKTAVDAELAAVQAKAAGSSKSSGYSIWVLLLVTVISSVGARFLPEDIPYI